MADTSALDALAALADELEAAKTLGYVRLITYTQDGESGASLRAAGWRVVAQRKPRPGWDMPSRRRLGNGNDNVARTLLEAS